MLWPSRVTSIPHDASGDPVTLDNTQFSNVRKRDYLYSKRNSTLWISFLLGLWDGLYLYMISYQDYKICIYSFLFYPCETRIRNNNNKLTRNIHENSCRTPPKMTAENDNENRIERWLLKEQPLLMKLLLCTKKDVLMHIKTAKDILQVCLVFS